MFTPPKTEPTTCVYSGNAICWEAADGLYQYDGYDAYYALLLNETDEEDHDESCDYHVDPTFCSCEVMADTEFESTEIWYSDKEILTDANGLWQTRGELIFVHNLEENTVQVTKSPLIWKRGLCSPCYPGQVEFETPGNFLGYRLLNEYLEEEHRV